MDIEQYRNYCLTKAGATESIPFSKLPDLLVFKVMGKMFTATDLSTFDSITIKCHPETIDQLRAEYIALEKPSYLSKKHWNSVLLDGSIPNKQLYEWIDISYNLVVKNLSKKVQTELKKQ
jgi:predicted DNA-binding protein (MmcQ/YjbR family)